eukprot:144230-Amphidinium_carterae.3
MAKHAHVDKGKLPDVNAAHLTSQGACLHAFGPFNLQDPTAQKTEGCGTRLDKDRIERIASGQARNLKCVA